jgi:hypothetical protein
MMEYKITKLLQIIPVIVVAGLIFLNGCYYDNEECLYPEGTTSCDTMNVTYSQNVWPVINDNCINCHSGGTPSGNISLENYDDIRASALIPAGNYGSLYGVISHAPGNSPMPKNAPKLPDCNIKQIEIWIEQGAPEN